MTVTVFVTEFELLQGVGFFVDPASCILYLFFLLCSGYFACCETAYTGVSKIRLRAMADKGNRRAERALWVCERFDKTLTTYISDISKREAFRQFSYISLVAKKTICGHGFDGYKMALEYLKENI